MTKRYIKPVEDNYDKQHTYAAMLSKHHLAIKHQFYLEAILIDYALMEDRLRSFIYHLGGMASRNDSKISGRGRKYIKQILQEYDPKANLGIGSIFGKRRIVRAVLAWKESTTESPKDKYLKALWTRLDSIDREKLKTALDNTESWCDYRNECIHSVMNKNLNSLNDEVAQKAEDGLKYVRIIDDQVKVLKRGNLIRKSVFLNEY